MALAHHLKNLSYLLSRRPYRLEKPVVLQFPVIDICNSQCQMCRIWENKKSDDLTPEQLRHGLRNPLYSEVASVGLNGGEPTLRKDLGDLAAVLFEELPRLRSVSLITNAYKHDEVIARITDVGEVVRRHGGRLDVMVSLDGFGDVHDRVRGKPGNFERAQQVIRFAKQSPLVHNLRIGCTIIKENVYGLADLFEYCQSEGLYVKYRLGIPHQRLYTQDLTDPYSLSAEDKYHVAEFLEGLIAHYETSPQQKHFYRSLIDQIIHQAPRKAGCDWQHRGATITSKGELLYCAVQSRTLGKITEQDSEQLYFGNNDHLQDILRNHCASCHHDYVGLPPRKQQVRQLAMLVARKLRAEPLLRKLYGSYARSDRRRRYQFAQRMARLNRPGAGPVPAWPSPRAGRRVLVCGWYGTETLGDKAILGGVLQALRTCMGTLDVALVSLYPYVSEMTRRQMDELKGVRIVDRENGLQLAGSAELVVFGGGPLMAIDELADMQAIFQKARNHGARTLVAGCGVGPTGAPWYNQSLRAILSLADMRIYRDDKSRGLAQGLGIDTNRDLVAEDPAFTWLARQSPEASPAQPSTPPVLVLGLRDFPYSAYATHLSERECLAAKARYEHAVIQALEVLTERHPDLIVRPLPMCTNHYGDDDRWFYRRLFRGHAGLAGRLDLSLLGRELAPEAYARAFREARVALTMRFHALVFALGLKVPSVAIDYTLGRGKVQALAERFEVPHQSLADLDSDFLVREIDRLLARPQPQAANFEPAFTQMLGQQLPSLLSPAKAPSAPA